MNCRLKLLSIAVLCVVASGCRPAMAPKTAAPAVRSSHPPANAGLASSSAGGTIQPLAAQGPAISDEEALALGRDLELAIAQGDQQKFSSLFDWNAFVESTAAGLPTDTRETRELRAGFAKGIEESTPQLSKQLVEQLGKGTYRMLGVRERPSGKRLLFRMTDANGALNYHEICLGRKGGDVRAVDVYVYLTAELTTETIRNLAITAMPQEKFTLLGRLSGADREAFEHMKTMREMVQAFHGGQPQQALELYATLPDNLQKTKPAMLIRTIAASQVDDQQYLAAIDAYRAEFPEDPSLELVSIDGYIVRKQFDLAHEAIERIDRAIGGDLYLRWLQGNVKVLAGKHDEALQIADEILKQDPQNQEAHWLQVSVALARKDHAQTAKILTKIRDELRIELLDLTKVPEYSDFVRSPEYEEWKLSILK